MREISQSYPPLTGTVKKELARSHANLHRDISMNHATALAVGFTVAPRRRPRTARTELSLCASRAIFPVLWPAPDARVFIAAYLLFLVHRFRSRRAWRNFESL
ncbi:hypothetical protein A0H81_08111 [Grifola frondosa]|uniref:Uncharacterized protein n=1 Tax=Grifola frondosa TaxID=5627 RepID=A0A1C7M4K7_GRIFR|nr:hypothetical protein A0H81_08111 [Grifola frondosa]